jgi:hypothetical protein
VVASHYAYCMHEAGNILYRDCGYAFVSYSIVAPV